VDTIAGEMHGSTRISAPEVFVLLEDGIGDVL